MRFLCFLFVFHWQQFLFAQIDTLFVNSFFDELTAEQYLIKITSDTSDGEVITRHVENDFIAEKYHLIRGKKYGAYRMYYPNGVLRIFGVYSNNLQHGDWSYYDEMGKLIVKGKFQMGEKHGYWSMLTENCFGRYVHNQKHGKWKCFENGFLKSQVYFEQGELLDGKPKGQIFNKEKSDAKSKPVKKSKNAQVEANKVMNPRFAENIYIGQQVYILEKGAKSMDEKISGKVSGIITKSDFDGRGIQVTLENGKSGRVVEFIDPPKNFESEIK